MSIPSDEHELRVLWQLETRRAWSRMVRRLLWAEPANNVVKEVQLVLDGQSGLTGETIAGNGDGGAVHQLGRAAVEVVLDRRPQTQEDPGKLVEPVCPGEPGLQGVLQTPMKPLYHPVGLGMIGGRGGEPDPEHSGHLGPKLGGELGSSVAGHLERDTETGHPVVQQRCAQGRGGGVGEGDGLRPSAEPVHDRQQVGAATGGGQGAHQVDVDVMEASAGHGDELYRAVDVAVDFRPLTWNTGGAPLANILVEIWPEKPVGHKAYRGLDAGVS